MKICELKINTEKNRQNVVVALAESGYKVSVEKRERENVYLTYDWYVVVEDIRKERNV